MMLKAAMIAALTSALSLVTVPLPFSPVPITGQTLGVCLSGLLLGPLWGTAGVGIYLAAGFFGLPVFSGGRSGFGTILGPTGGYILSFIPAAVTTGLIALPSGRYGPGQAGLRNKKGPPGLWRLIAASVAGSIVVVHAIGAPYLAWQTGMSLKEALLAGSIPFLAGDIVKAFLASIVALRYHRAVR
ncbi:MAG: biotin transporter BioY [Firmicutes bacterium]|jgi:biotin transport system substrate-specific component|nr:biotin transporter BioY [Candidatus Fermentithermobacillaceae bacterium]